MENRKVSRREFLKIAGLAGAVAGVGTGLGGLVAACGDEERTTTTGAAVTMAPTTTTAPTATSAASTTTVSAGTEQGRPVKIGLVSPKTGQFAAFAVPLDYLITRWKEATADGVRLADGKNHPFELIVKDTQSDTARAAAVAAELIQNDKVDLVLSFGSPDTVNPTADQCETFGMPSLSAFCPWEPFFFGRGRTPDNPFKWTYLADPGVADFLATEMDMFSKIPTNKVVGLLFPNTVDGAAYVDENTGFPPLLKAGGYTQVFSGLYTPMQEDFTTQISEFKKAGCELAVGSPPPPDFANFWKQCLQQKFQPKIVSMGMALLFPQTLEAVGPSACNVIVECPWHPAFPYVSSLTGETCRQLADDYESKTGLQWTPPLGIYGLYEWAVDVLKRAADIDDKETILAAITSTNMETLYAKIDFSATSPGPKRPVQNVAVGSMCGGQWVKGKGKWQFDLEIVSNALGPDLPITAEMQPMHYE